VNIFMGARLLATSERNLFASGLLPTRTNAEVYRALGLRNEAALVTQERIGAFEYLVAATPLTVRQLGILTVPLTSRQREIDQQIDTLDRRALLAALLFILGGAALGYSMAERISDPVNRLTRATRRIARGDLDARIAATSSDELRRLVEAFNSMAADLQRQRGELERTHRLEAWAEMARQVAHEIKNPLTPIQLCAERIRRHFMSSPPPLRELVDECTATITGEVESLKALVDEFAQFARMPAPRTVPSDLNGVLADTLALYNGLFHEIQIERCFAETLPPVRVDVEQMRRVVINLVDNAVEALGGSQATLRPSGESPTIVVETRHDRVNGVARVRVSDNGPGIPQGDRDKLFMPYYSTKRRGSGLGLAIVRRIVAEHGGSIEVEDNKPVGTTFTIELPT